MRDTPEITKRFVPTRAQVRGKWTTDLQVEGLQTLAEAARSSRPADYIACILDTIRDCYQPRETTYLVKFILHHADLRGLLGDESFAGPNQPRNGRFA